jgi:hypothetical protein
MPRRVLLYVAFALVPALACAARIELTDGTVIIGEPVGLSQGRYTIETPALGRIQVEAARVRSIRKDSTAGTATPSISQGEIDALQRRIAASPGLMQAITALQNDPQIRAALNDPEFMSLLMARDLDGLQRNPRFRALLSNPVLRSLVNKLGGP